MPRIRYKNAKGELLKGATTVAKQVGWGSGGLMWWANKQGLEGRTLQESYDTATIPGTIAHYLIECFLKNEEPQMSLEWSNGDIEKARVAFQNFHNWAKQFKFEPIHVEPNLISEKWQYGGTPDVIAMILGEPAIVDWKTGKIYESTFLQLVAYRQLCVENYPDLPLNGGFHLLRIPKNEKIPSFHHSHWGVLPPEAWETFEMCLRLRKCEKVLKGLL